MREYKKYEVELIAIAFASWLNLHQRIIDFREEKKHTYDELFDIFMNETKIVKEW